MRIRTIDAHTAGEPLRLIVSGFPTVEGRTILEQREFVRERYDHLRRALMLEPRGHADMYGALLTPPEHPGSHAGVLFMHNEGYSTMCGHAIIALTTLAVETGLGIRRAPTSSRDEVEVSFNVPAGRIEARAELDQGRARNVRFRNVPSFLYLDNQHLDVPGLGRVQFDIAYGGAFYAIVPALPGLELIPSHFNRLIESGRLIKHAVMDAFTITHPFESDLSFLYGTIFTAPAQQASHHSRNVCIFAEGELDRSPTGSGVSARAALHHAKGEVGLNQSITIESILGSTMSVAAVERTKYGPYAAIIPEVAGSASITGRNEFYFDPEDTLRSGFIFR